MANSPSGESVIERFLRILEAFDAHHRVLSLTEIADRARLPVSTAHRLTAEMVRVGSLRRSDVGGFEIGIRIWELSNRSSETQRLREAALPAMLNVQKVVGQHTNLAVRDGDHVVYLERLSAPTATRSIALTASRLPLNLTSSGLVLIAFSPPRDLEVFLSTAHPKATADSPAATNELVRRIRQVRADGYCIADGYSLPDSTGIAVPVFHPRERVVAALNVIVPRGDDRSPSLVPLLRGAARGIARALAAA
ncbi:MAG: IclR family transcriptional regulator [Leucobacter sp.]